MMIDHAYHRQGLGTLLLRQIEQALGQTYDELKLESYAPHQPANDFYRHNGWLETARFFDNEAGVHKLVLKKTTGRA